MIDKLNCPLKLHMPTKKEIVGNPTLIWQGGGLLIHDHFHHQASTQIRDLAEVWKKHIFSPGNEYL